MYLETLFFVTFSESSQFLLESELFTSCTKWQGRSLTSCHDTLYVKYVSWVDVISLISTTLNADSCCYSTSVLGSITPSGQNQSFKVLANSKTQTENLRRTKRFNLHCSTAWYIAFLKNYTKCDNDHDDYVIMITEAVITL